MTTAAVAALLPLLVAQAGLAATGDLDPTFGQLGRTTLARSGPAWFAGRTGDSQLTVAGGESGFSRYSYDDFLRPVWQTRGFVERISDSPSTMPLPSDTAVLAAQPEVDGSLVAVGRTSPRSLTPLKRVDGQAVVLRLAADGALDAGFGDAGVVKLTAMSDQALTAVALEPDHRIVAVGYEGDHLLVRRFLPDGTADSSFQGDARDGIAVARGFYPRLARLGSGAYRVLLKDNEGCQVLALMPDGTVDANWGNAGRARLALPDGLATCFALAVTGDGRLLVAGATSEHAAVVRLAPTGAIDTGFASGALQGMSAVTALLAPASEERIYVAGPGEAGIPGVQVRRLTVDGASDKLFGDDGNTWIDLENSDSGFLQVNVLAMAPGNALLVAGGRRSNGIAGSPFVGRLVGGGSSPGVLGFERPVQGVAEGSTASVTVRRMGGGAGAVSVAYRITAYDTASPYTATPGDDFDLLEGELHWSDGDRGNREIEIPIALNQASPAEEEELFGLDLVDATGGAGLGSSQARLTIRADGGTAGLFDFDSSSTEVDESAGHVDVNIVRKYASQGAVSVTLSTAAGTAKSGDDFTAQSIVVSWPDGDNVTKAVSIPIIDDGAGEGDEEFQVALTDATGGAVIGPMSHATITIVANDQPPTQTPTSGSGSDGGNGGSGSGGGGSFETGGLLLATALALACRQRRRPISGISG